MREGGFIAGWQAFLVQPETLAAVRAALIVAAM